MKERLFFKYVKARKSWIVFFAFILVILNFLVWIDEGIQIEKQAISYLNILLAVLFTVFFIWRYFVEMAYFKNLLLFSEGVSFMRELLPKALNDFDEMMNDVIKEVILKYEDSLHKTKSENQIANDYTAAWIHEVKTPLTAMKLIMDSEPNNPLMRKLQSEWLRIHLLLDQQLSMTRIATLSADYIPEMISLQKIVTAEVKELATWCFEKQLAIEIIDNDFQVLTDEKWSRFIVRQILTNAIKYSPQGSTIDINFHKDDSGHKSITITDNGSGITAHDLPRIFEKGYTGSTGRISNAATGLGLFLANDVAKRLKIRLQASSTIGFGTSLTITFPTENDYDKVKLP